MKKVVNLVCIVSTLAILITSCQNATSETKTNAKTDGFTINGSLKNTSVKKLFIYYQTNDVEVNDSIAVVDGEFSYSGKVAYPHLATIVVDDDLFEFFFLDNSEITINIDAEADKPNAINGVTHSEYKQFLAQTQKPFEAEKLSLELAYDNTEDEAKLNDIEAQIDALTEKEDKLQDDYIAAHPNSFVSAYVIARKYNYNPNPDTLQRIYENLGEHIKNSGAGKKIVGIIETARKTAIGAIAEDISETNPEGEVLKLSDLRGQYVLLDFWASWCAPCRAEFPYLKEAYSLYHDKGFEIYAVSLDVFKEPWVEAIAEEDLDWLQVSDLKVIDVSKPALKYGVTAIPTNFLLDKNGKIIAKNLEGEALKEKLATLL